MAIETKNTLGGELIYKQSNSPYVGQYYTIDGVFYAGNPNSGVTGANNGNNPNQQTELIRVTDKQRSTDGYIQAPFGQTQNFPFNLRQDIYETVDEIIDTNISELKPTNVSKLTPEQILRNRITELFKEYSELKEFISGTGQSESHNFLVNSSLPYTGNFDDINEIVEGVPGFVYNESTTLGLVPDFEGVTPGTLEEGPNTYQWPIDDLDINTTNIPSRVVKIMGSSESALYHNGTWVGSLQKLIKGETYMFSIDGQSEYLWQVGEQVPTYSRFETNEFLATTYNASTFQPSQIKTEKRNLEVEQLLHERGDEADTAEIDYLRGLVSRLEGEISGITGQLSAQSASNASLQQQLDGTLSILNEDEEETLADLLDDPGKADVVWEEKFPFPALPEFEGNWKEEIKFLENWSYGGLENYVIPNGGFQGSMRIIRKTNRGTNGKHFATAMFLKANQTYTFSAYVRLGTMGRIRMWLGDGERPGTPNYITSTTGPYDWKYSWTAYLDFYRSQIEDSTGRYKFEEIDYEVPHAWNGQNNARFKNFITPISGSNKFDGSGIIEGIDDEEYKYHADADGKWYKVEFDFTPHQNIYQGKKLEGYADSPPNYVDGRYQGAPFCRTTLIIYEGGGSHDPGEYVEWSDLKIFERKESHYNPEQDFNSEYLINKPFVNDGINDRTLEGRKYESKRYVSSVMNTADITKYRTWPPNWQFTDDNGNNWAFASNVGVWTDAGLLGQAGAGNEPADVTWNYGVNLLQNFDFRIYPGGTGEPQHAPVHWSTVDVDDPQADSKANTSAPGVYPGTIIHVWASTAAQGAYIIQSRDNEPALGSAIDNALPGEDAHVDNYKFGENLMRVDWNSGGSDGHVWGFFQDVDVSGAGGEAYFKLGAYQGGISNQNDRSQTFVRFFNAAGNIIVPDNPMTIVHQMNELSDWEDSLDTEPSYVSKNISYNGVEQTMRMCTAMSPNGSQCGYMGQGNVWNINYYSFGTDIMNGSERSIHGINWTALCTKLPPGATKARIYVGSQKLEGPDGDGYVGPVLFKLYDSLQNPGTIDLI